MGRHTPYLPKLSLEEEWPGRTKSPNGGILRFHVGEEKQIANSYQMPTGCNTLLAAWRFRVMIQCSLPLRTYSL